MNNLLTSLGHIWQLGVKELRSLWRDRLLLLFVIWAFSGALYTAAKAAPDRLHRAAIAVVDEDQSPLSQRIVTAFYPPTFMKPTAIGLQDMDAGMDAGRFTFVMDIPPDFQSDVLAGKQPSIQLNVDATQMSQAFLGAGYIQSIALGEVADSVYNIGSPELDTHDRFGHRVDLVRFHPAYHTLMKTAIEEGIHLRTQAGQARHGLQEGRGDVLDLGAAATGQQSSAPASTVNSSAAMPAVATLGQVVVSQEELQQFLQVLPAAQREAMRNDRVVLEQWLRSRLAEKAVVEQAKAQEWDKKAEIRSAIEEAQMVCCATAASKSEAMAQLAHTNPDAIVVDLNLPDGSGLDVCRTLRASPQTRRIPLIALSADALPDHIARALQAGFDHYLVKPIQLKRLLGILSGIRAQPPR